MLQRSTNAATMPWTKPKIMEERRKDFEGQLCRFMQEEKIPRQKSCAETWEKIESILEQYQKCATTTGRQGHRMYRDPQRCYSESVIVHAFGVSCR